MCFLMFEQTDTINVSVFEVSLIQTAKSKSKSCLRKQSSHELWPICEALLSSKFGKRELILV